MNTQDQSRHLPRSLLLAFLFILALLMSLCFMILFAQLTLLSGEKQEWLEASMATKLEADYSPDNWVEMPRFAPLKTEVIGETVKEVGRDEDSPPTPPEPVEPQADSPQSIMPIFMMPVYEWPSD